MSHSNDRHRRGPRVMHGGAALMAQARDLPTLAQVRPDVQREADAMRARARARARRLQVAERRVQYMEEAITAFEQQAAALPAEHAFRTAAEAMLLTFRKLLAKADEEIPR